MTMNEQQTPEHPPRPNWNARETAIVLSLGLLLLSVVIDFMVDQQLDWRAFLADLPPNIVGALIVFWLFEFAYSRRQHEEQKAQETEEATDQLKRDLIVRMGSQVNDTAVSAANELRARGWLEDDSLKGVGLGGANLEGADLEGINLSGATLSGARLNGVNLSEAILQGANLLGARLQEADLYIANLEGADLREADLQGANLDVAILRRTNLGGAKLQRAELKATNLTGADLCNANLHKAYLQEANLERANLRGACFVGANLHGANLELAKLQGTDLTDAKFSEDTVLPDGTFWTSETDMTRFTAG